MMLSSEGIFSPFADRNEVDGMSIPVLVLLWDKCFLLTQTYTLT